MTDFQFSILSLWLTFQTVMLGFALYYLRKLDRETMKVGRTYPFLYVKKG
jgi:hypothetical protein